MDAEIIYELERNHVYGSLGRAVQGLLQNSHGLLAEERTKVKPLPITNDAYFYRQVIVAHNTLGALQEFCEARCRGVEYYEARRQLMDVFEPFVNQSFSDEEYAAFLPSRMEPLPGATDEEKEKTYRASHLEEFKTVVFALDSFLHKERAHSWSNQIVFSQLNERLDSFKDPAVADKGFDKFPVPREIAYFADAIKWLKERSTQALARANVNIKIDTTGLPGMFGRVAGNSPEDKLKYLHYQNGCESLGVGLVDTISTSRYLQILCLACPSAGIGFNAVGSYTSDVSVNLPQALSEFSSIYMDVFIDSLPEDMDAQSRSDMIEGLQNVTTDFMDEFIYAPKHQPAPAAKAFVWQEIKL